MSQWPCVCANVPGLRRWIFIIRIAWVGWKGRKQILCFQVTASLTEVVALYELSPVNAETSQ